MPTRLTINLSQEYRKKLRTVSGHYDLTMTDFIKEVIENNYQELIDRREINPLRDNHD